MRRSLPLLLLTLTLGACAGQKAQSRNDLDATPAKSTTLQVTTVAARSGTLTAQRSASATVQAQRDAQVAALTGGTVKSLLACEGEQVARGQVIAQLDDTPQRQALQNARLQLQQAQISLAQTRRTAQGADASLQAAVSAAQASLAQAQLGAQSAEKLYRLGGVSLADLQAARAQLAQAQSSVAQARNALAQNGKSAQNSVPLQEVQLAQAQAGVQQAQENLTRTAVRAPFAGRVAALSVEVGEFVGQGAPVFRLVDPGSIRVKFSVAAADAAALTDGATLNVGFGGENYVGVVTGTPGIAGTNRLVPVTARVQGGANLPVGAVAQARYRVTLGRGVLVPSGAVQADAGQNVVYTVSGGAARRTPVTVLAESAGLVALRGLSAGAAVVNPVPASLQDGAKVQSRVAGAAQ
ncbi:HlyD family efflux transporter periplasmic adaptor subunit (plasmid) [Deinococcus taeanensis]|uniref:efflux RND transporter periplasmic adaptor subunit n=1 Tax=Deinococcus taeanensis TaxID=2737050 RepID=UPI001CDC7431|nr:HlyD family efflux transporter periplasmic adaptor subunit [Deinococcus taeanensis]UBV44891.1 HlyD family efflux transporter periplasmic adaptor subunit [Deinococcus taeanensis]